MLPCARAPTMSSLILRRWIPVSTFSPSKTSFSSAAARASYYERTIEHLKIGRHTRVIFQGFTGRQATANAKESIEWGTRIVGGVTPGRDGEHLGLPVLPSVRAAKDHLKPDATGIYVAAHQAAAAIEEAIEAEIPLIVAVAEHIPLHDILRIHSMLNTQGKSRLVGANAPGIISAIGRCRIGFQPLPTFAPGHVGIVAKSGTLSYETVASVTRAGLGQSLCIGMGGDVVAGTNFVDALKVFEHDSDTEGIILVGEIGGRAEEEAAEWIKEYKRRSSNPKPIAALVGGILAPPGRVMGHAGAWVGPGENSAEKKYRILQDAGAVMVDHPSHFGQVMKDLLAKSGRNVQKIQNSASASAASGSQRRSYHTSARRPRPTPASRLGATPFQKRGLHLNSAQAADLLSQHGITVGAEPLSTAEPSRLISLTIDRSARSPSFYISPSTHPKDMHARARHIPFSYNTGPTQETLDTVLQHTQLSAAPADAVSAVVQLLRSLWSLYTTHEAITLSTHVSLAPSTKQGAGSSPIQVTSPSLSFDDAAFRSCKRHADLHALRDTSPSAIDAAELAAERHGIVYIKLPGANNAGTNQTHSIGTLVNGAGLAMNTVDALSLPSAGTSGSSGSHVAANFLDTGGKATSETVARSFELLLGDPRVAVIFVNIFGGLTLCDMIARGVLLAFEELGLEERGVPVVVRLRGTREKEGQAVIAQSGKRVWAFDGFDEAVAKCKELARERSGGTVGDERHC
ncbi:succinyl-CoA synthetase-like protein [Phyllosticta capitalensis]|uniref:Succinyl-CoA synthetase-like protein n=1 Tax=Phyllosticta capitalensis TaxID=121624 RepID=A0ABR1YPS5_9PEZI